MWSGTIQMCCIVYNIYKLFGWKKNLNETFVESMKDGLAPRPTWPKWPRFMEYNTIISIWGIFLPHDAHAFDKVRKNKVSTILYYTTFINDLVSN